MQVQLKPWGNSQGIRFSPGEISRVLAELIFLGGQKTSRIQN